MKLTDIVNSNKIVPLAIGGRIADVVTQFVGTEFYGKREASNPENIDLISDLCGPHTGMLAREALYWIPLITIAHLLNQLQHKTGDIKIGNIALTPLTIGSYTAALYNLYVIANF
ncbi:MAG: hypothetical protein Q8P81_01560 [Nanoarchaeota archaeon]|nr:hypothetical protein [Nanoarchaeota archaeon]